MDAEWITPAKYFNKIQLINKFNELIAVTPFECIFKNGTQSLRCFVTKDVENLEKEVERWVENFVFPGELTHRAIDHVPNSIFPSSKLLPESAWMGNLIENDWAYLKFDALDNNKSWSSFFSLTKERAGILLNRHALKSKRGFGLEFVVWSPKRIGRGVIGFNHHGHKSLLTEINGHLIAFSSKSNVELTYRTCPWDKPSRFGTARNIHANSSIFFDHLNFGTDANGKFWGDKHIDFIHQYQQELAPQKRLVLHDTSPQKKNAMEKPKTSTPKKGTAKRVILGKRPRGGFAGPSSSKIPRIVVEADEIEESSDDDEAGSLEFFIESDSISDEDHTFEIEEEE